MILSTKGRYGLKAAFELSKNYGLGPVSLKKISEKYGISENYLEQLFANCLLYTSFSPCIPIVPSNLFGMPATILVT